MTEPTLILGDCREVLPTLPADSAHLMLTDPPYFLDGLDNDWEKGNEKGGGVVGGLPIGMKFDDQQGRRLEAFITECGAAALRVLRPGAFAVVFSQARLTHRMATGLEEAGFEIRDLWAWHYPERTQLKAFGLSHLIDRSTNLTDQQKADLKADTRGRKTPQLRPQFEMMVFAQKPKAGSHIETWQQHRTGLIDATEALAGERTPSTLMSVAKEPRTDTNTHLTIKPVRLLRHLIRLLTEPNQTVLDPFSGSGSTSMAAKAEHRASVGIEINADYHTLATVRASGEHAPDCECMFCSVAAGEQTQNELGLLG